MAWNHQTINHVKQNISNIFGMEQGRWSDPSQWLDRFIFDCFFVATSGSAVEPSCRILCGMASRGGDPSRWLECFQQIKQSNHVKHMIFQTFGMDWATGEVSHPVHWLDHFFVDCFFILLPPVAALWNQTVEFVWHGQQGGGLTPFTDWIDLFFQQAKPSNHVYFLFFEEEVVWPHYLECWSFFDRFRHAERSKQWNQGELPISPFFCLAASLEGRQIQTNQWKVVWQSEV